MPKLNPPPAPVEKLRPAADPLANPPVKALALVAGPAVHPAPAAGWLLLLLGCGAEKLKAAGVKPPPVAAAASGVPNTFFCTAAGGLEATMVGNATVGRPVAEEVPAAAGVVEGGREKRVLVALPAAAAGAGESRVGKEKTDPDALLKSPPNPPMVPRAGEAALTPPTMGGKAGTGTGTEKKLAAALGASAGVAALTASAMALSAAA